MAETKHNRLLELIGFGALGLIWGSNFLYMRLAVKYISPVQVVFLRVLLSVVLIIAYGFLRGSFKREQLRYWYHFLVMSVLATVIYYFCFVQGSHLLYSGIAGALSGAAPVFTFILGLIFLKEEKMGWQKIAGLLLGIAGIVILAKPFSATITPDTWKGILYMIAGSLSFGASFIYARKYVTPLRINAVALTSYQLLGAMLILFIITPLKGITAVFYDTKAALGLVIGLSFLGTGLAYLIYYFLIDKMGAIKASSVTYIPPIVALIVGATMGREPILWTDYAGAAIVLAGVYFLKRK